MFKFTYKFVVYGRPEGLFTKQGSLTAKGIQLGNEFLPYFCIFNCERVPDGGQFRSDRLSLEVTTDQQVLPRPFLEKVWENRLVLQIYNAPAEQMRKEIVIRCSRHEIARIKEKLEGEGRGESFRSAVCPYCNAALNLTNLPSHPYVFCRHCEAFWKKDFKLEMPETYKVCDDCGFFDRTQDYTEFYCYPWWTAIHLAEAKRTLCDPCARTLARKMLSVNIFFLVGVPNALWCIIRSLARKDRRARALTRANSLAREGKVGDADKLYNEVLQHFPDHPGIRYDQARANLRAQKVEEGVEHLNEVLKSHPNFHPAGKVLDHLASTELVAKTRTEGRDQAVIIGSRPGEQSSDSSPPEQSAGIDASMAFLTSLLVGVGLAGQTTYLEYLKDRTLYVPEAFANASPAALAWGFVVFVLFVVLDNRKTARPAEFFSGLMLTAILAVPAWLYIPIALHPASLTALVGLLAFHALRK